MPPDVALAGQHMLGSLPSCRLCQPVLAGGRPLLHRFFPGRTAGHLSHSLGRAPAPFRCTRTSRTPAFTGIHASAGVAARPGKHERQGASGKRRSSWLGRSPGPCACARKISASAAASTAAWPGKYDGEEGAGAKESAGADPIRGASVMLRPAQLPDPPASSRLLDVMPYLLKLATSDRQLWWRLGAAVLLMFASKAAGAPGVLLYATQLWLVCVMCWACACALYVCQGLSPPSYSYFVGPGSLSSHFRAPVPGLATPIFLRRAVDALGGVVTDARIHTCAMALLASGACRIANSLTKELQGPIFTPVSQARRPRVRQGTCRACKYRAMLLLRRTQVGCLANCEQC